MIAFDTTASGSASPASSPLTFSHTMSASANGLILIGVECQSDSVTGVTFNGISTTQLVKKVIGASTTIYIYGLLAPATGSQTVSIAYTGSLFVRAISASYTGVKQSGLPDAVNSINSTSSIASITGSVTTVANPTWTASFTWGTGTTTTASTGGTQRAQILSAGMWMDSNAGITPQIYNMTAAFSPNSTTEEGMVLVSFADINPSTTRGGSFLNNFV